jgi:hypothetical protein
MIVQKNKKKKLIYFNLLGNFQNVNYSLNNEHRNLFRVHRQIFKGNKVLSRIKIFDRDNNPNSSRNNNDKKTIDKNDEFEKMEINPVNRLNIYNYKMQLKRLLGNKEERNDSKNNLPPEKEKSNQFTIIKSLLDQLNIENENKIQQKRLKYIDSHDCNKRKKLKLKPLKIIPSISIDNSISRSNKSIFNKKIDYYNNQSKLKNCVTNNDKIQDYINNQNTSYYSTLFRNTSVNIIKNKKNGENEYENPYYSPSLKKNMWEEFQTIDNGECETIEKSMMIKEGINEINNNKYKIPLYMSERRINNKIKEIDITKIRSIKDIETILFKKKDKNKENFIYKNIRLKKLNPISPKELKNQ